MRRFIIAVVVIVVVVGAAGYYGKKELANVASSKIVQELNTSAGRAELHKVLQNPQVQAEIAKLKGMNTGGLYFDNEQQAVQYAVNKLPPKETIHLTKDYLNRNNLTQQQIHQDEQEVLSTFTPQQLAAIADTLPQS